MQEEEEEDDIYAPDDSIPGLSTPAPTSGGGDSGSGGAIQPNATDELEEGEEEDEEMEEDYGESDSVGVFFFLFLSVASILREKILEVSTEVGVLGG